MNNSIPEECDALLSDLIKGENTGSDFAIMGKLHATLVSRVDQATADFWFIWHKVPKSLSNYLLDTRESYVPIPQYIKKIVQYSLYSLTT